MSSSNCCFLTCIQIFQEAGRWPGIPISLRIFQFVVVHTVRGFSIINEADVDVFMEFLWFFYGPRNVGSLISCFSAFSKSSLCIWKFLVHVLLKPGLKDFEPYLSNMWNERNCVAVWTFCIALLCDWNENWPFPVLWPRLSFPNLLAYWVQHLTMQRYWFEISCKKHFSKNF